MDKSYINQISTRDKVSLVELALPKTEADKMSEVVARLNKLAKKHLEIETRMKKLEESIEKKGEDEGKGE